MNEEILVDLYIKSNTNLMLSEFAYKQGRADAEKLNKEAIIAEERDDFRDWLEKYFDMDNEMNSYRKDVYKLIDKVYSDYLSSRPCRY